MPTAETPIPYLPIDSPIPFITRYHVAKSKRSGSEPVFDRQSAIDEIADLQAAMEEAQAKIQALRESVIKSISDFGKEAQYDFDGQRYHLHLYTAPYTSVAWRKVAEAAGAEKDLIAMHSQTRQQTYFKITPKEQGK